ncbi:hypothetical protein CPB84DRAFT_1846103 [Gymnopilus junonius]|uniref:RING-type domain-containing protein n=1 Tax=Gymnopilus junonius TaxID=109634 RepID=A0A9P5NRA0_GYMJU|nr:hypothetical protein CPB84DRAFT_1846103 [Gymnopilus junonius]
MSSLGLLSESTAKLTGTSPSAAPPPWRQFPFFDALPVKDVHDLSSTPDIFKATPEISTMSRSTAGILVADIHGSIHLLNRDFESINSWVAHVGGRVTHMVERKGVLVTLGEEDSVRSPLLKIWDLQNNDKKTGSPFLLRSTKVQLSNRPHPVTTVALSDTLAHLAIGLGDGTVILYRHLDQSLSSSTTLTSLPKARTIFESPMEPITGLGFREPFSFDSDSAASDSQGAERSESFGLGLENPASAPSPSPPPSNSNPNPSNLNPDLEAADPRSQNHYLFIVTLSRVLCYQVSGRGSGGTPSVVDEIGAGLGCVVMDRRKRNVVVAREEAIYVCGVDGRGACWAYEAIPSHRPQIFNPHPPLIPRHCLTPFIPSATSPSATVRNLVARGGGGGPEGDVTKVTIFDPENKLVAYSDTFGLTRLLEKPTSAKLSMLYAKSLYGLALSLASTQKLDPASVADIHRQYGDALYSKGDFDAAMVQYVRTIGWVQPSYVIRKDSPTRTTPRCSSTPTPSSKMSPSRLLYQNRIPTPRAGASSNPNDPDELPFDLTTAIRVCRQAGYFDHASYLAKKYERHEEYLRIQIEDAGRVGDALVYLRRLGSEAAESNLARYGRAMLDALPEETTQLLIDLCTTTGPLDSSSPSESEGQVLSPSEAKPAAPAPSYLSYLALNRDRGSTSGGAPTIIADKDRDRNNRTATPPSPSIKTVRGVDRDRDNASTRRGSLHEVTSPTSTSTPPPSAITVVPPHTASSILGPGPGSARMPSSSLAYQQLQPPAEPKVKRLSPRIYFPHFVEHMDQFVVFLETVALRRWGQSVEDQAPGSVGLYSGKEGGKERERDEAVENTLEDEVLDKLDQIAVWNTLLELYLTLPLPVKAGGKAASSASVNGSSDGSNGTVNGTSTGAVNGTTTTTPKASKSFDEKLMREKAMRVLQSPTIPYDATHALILCSTHGFTDGLVLLWEKMGMFEDVLRFWMDKSREDSLHYPNASQKVIEHLMYYGQEKGQKHLYPLVLRFLTSTPELLARHQEDVKGILEVVEDEKLMPPLGVVQVLSRNGVASVGLIKEWLVGRIKESREEIQNDQALIKSYRLETAARLKQVKDLTNTEEPRVFHVTRCSTCLGQLDLPSVHFMCNHSYHQRCIADNEAECPACAREHGIIREIRLNNQKLADQHDVFLAEVQESGFEAIAAAFGRGVLNSQRVEDATA